MSKAGYYSPAILGALAALVYAVFGHGNYTTADRALIAGVGAPAVALACQLLMISAQGVFAGVLPVPFGRTLRGRKCVAIGVLLIVGMVLAVMAWLASQGGGGTLRFVCVLVGAGCWLVALGLYGWSAPTAKADFGGVEPA